METRRGHLGGPVEYSEGKGGESVMAILRFLCGSSRLCRLKTEGLVPVSKYWTYQSHAGVMGPVNRCSLFVNRCLTFITASMTVLGEKLGGGPMDHSARLGLCQEPIFSGAVGFVQRWWWLVKGCHVWRLPVGSVRRAYLDWRGKCMCHVDQVFPCRVYIDLNHCDSRIWVTASSWLPSSSN
jgi:hypothetical protein